MASFICRSIYEDQVLGNDNLRMIDIARSYGSSAKFSGSGGAVVGLSLDSTKTASVHHKTRLIFLKHFYI